MLTPTVIVSGHRVNSRFGTMDIPVWAGPNRVDVHTTWMKEYGQASLDVVVHPGEVVPVYYAVPWHQFSRGSIGHEKQRRKGLGAFAVILGAVVVVPLLFILLGEPLTRARMPRAGIRHGLLRSAPGVRRRPAHSHSMVPGGLLVTSRTTRLTSRTSLVMRVEILASTS